MLLSEIDPPYLTQDDLDKISDWIFEGLHEKPGRFSGMSYEQGADDFLSVLAGDLSVDDFCESRD